MAVYVQRRWAVSPSGVSAMRASMACAGSVAGVDDDARTPAQSFEVDIPDPGDVRAVGAAVVETDEEPVAASKVDRRAQRLVEPCRVLGQDDVEFAALGIEPLL